MLTFLLVPFYTYILSTTEFGTIDIVTTTVSLFMPILTLSIAEAALRFSMDKDLDLGKVLSNSILILFIGNLLLVAAFPVLIQIGIIKEYIYLFYLMMFTSGLQVVVSQFCRGSGKVKEFAFGGVLSTIALISSNIVFLLVFNLGIKGYLLSIVISHIVPLIYFGFVLRIRNYFWFFDKALAVEMLIYSIPMIPNALSWWAMSASDKYVILYSVGVATNGLYVVAQKLPSIINVINSVFMQSWQLSAVDESKSLDRNAFYSTTFNYLSMVLLITNSLLTLIIKPFYTVWLTEMYFEAWKYTTILLLANTFSCFSMFAGTNYIAMKKTKGNFKTTIVGCLTNIILNLIFIPKFGLYAAATTTMFSFMLTWILRIIDTRNYVQLNINYIRLILGFFIIAVQYTLLYVDYPLIIRIIPFMFMLALYTRDLIKLMQKIMNIIKRRRFNG